MNPKNVIILIFIAFLMLAPMSLSAATATDAANDRLRAIAIQRGQETAQRQAQDRAHTVALRIATGYITLLAGAWVGKHFVWKEKKEDTNATYEETLAADAQQRSDNTKLGVKTTIAIIAAIVSAIPIYFLARMILTQLFLAI